MHFDPTHTVDIVRRSQSGSTGGNVDEPLYGDTTAASDVKLEYADESTSFVREDSGERVNKPARGKVRGDIDVQEGDRLTNNADLPDFEVRGITEVRGQRRGIIEYLTLELERDD